MGELIGALPPHGGPLVDCPQVYLYPNRGGWDAEMQPPDYYRDYQQVVDRNTDYQEIVTKYDEYRDLLSGTIVRPPPGGGGLGWVGGVNDANGVEVWVTKVEGWDEGQQVEAKQDNLGLMAGTHVAAVLGRGREVVITGSLFDPSGGAKLPEAQRLLGSALGTSPHLGWLTIDGLWLPVALSSVVKQARVDSHRVDFEFTLKGRDGVSPGHGVHLESHPGRSLTLNSGSPVTDVQNDGFLGVFPVLSWRPENEFATVVVTLTEAGSSQAMSISSSGIGNTFNPDVWLRIDMNHRRVDAMSVVDLEVAPIAPGRHLIDWAVSDWLEIPPFGCSVDVNMTVGTSTLSMDWNELS